MGFQPYQSESKPLISCQEEGCTERATSRGMCKRHYASWYQRQRKQQGTLKTASVQAAAAASNEIPRGSCRMMGCEETEMNNYLCRVHYELVFGNRFDYDD